MYGYNCLSAGHKSAGLSKASDLSQTGYRLATQAYVCLGWVQTSDWP